MSINREARRVRSSRQPEAPFPWLWVLGSFCLSALMVFAWALLEQAFWPTLPSEIIGVWTPRDPKQERMQIEFRTDQFMVIRRIVKGQPVSVEARVRLDDDLLVAFVTDPKTGEETTTFHVVKRLTRTELVLEDARGDVLLLTRVE